MFPNDTDDWVLPPGDSYLLPPRSIRIYEFMHGFEDISIEEYNRRENHPFNKILAEEIIKEINREIIEKIAVAAKRF